VVESSVPSRQQPAVVLELKERLFGRTKGHIIELGAPPVFPSFFPELTLFRLLYGLYSACRCWNRDRLAGSCCFALSESATSSASHAESCILSTDLREFLIRSRCRTRWKLRPFFFRSCVASSMELMSHNIRTNAALYLDCPPTALPLDWDEELPEMVQDVRERGALTLLCKPDTRNTASGKTFLSN
jgi:hypothetical protein